MKRFMSSAASSSSGRARPPAAVSSNVGSAEQPATSLRSAEPPASPCHLKISSIRDVQRWLAEEPIASCSSADMQRIREAVDVLSTSKPRQEDVRPLQSKWQVAQKKDKKPRPLEEVLREFQGKVIKAAEELQQELASLPDSSAARPAAKAGGPAELLNLRECKNWLQALPSHEILQNTPLQRLQEVMDLLQRPSSREQRQEIQKLLGNWGVLQKTQGHKRKYDATKADLVAKVVEETHRLKRMRHEFVEPIPDGSDTNTSARFSAIQASLQHQSRGRLL